MVIDADYGNDYLVGQKISDGSKHYDDKGQEFKYECEYGSCNPIRFPEPQSVGFFDSDGNEIEVPKCDKCGSFKNPLIGKEAFQWICMNC